ncbi:MAG: hypothetical protein ACP5N2_01020 [Candidatus Nanoarchaeia archaeon]
MSPEEFMAIQEMLAESKSSIFDYLAGVKIPQKRGRKPGPKKEIAPKPYEQTGGRNNYQKQATTTEIAPTVATPSIINEDISNSAYQSLQDTLTFFRKRTENKTLEEMAHKFQSKLRTNNQSATEIMNSSLIGIISHQIYEEAAAEAQKRGVEVKEDNLKELSGFHLTTSAVHHIMGNLTKEYLRTAYPVNKDIYANEDGTPYLIEGTVTIKKDAIFKHIHAAIEHTLVKIIKDEIQVLEDLKRELTAEPIAETTEKVVGYCIRQNGKTKGTFAGFWHFAENRIKETRGITYKLIGKGSSAARGSNPSTGVTIECKDEVLADVATAISTLVNDYNKTNGSKIYISENKKRPEKNGHEPKVHHPDIQTIKDEIKTLKTKEFSYFGAGVKGFETYIYLQQSLESNGYKLAGKVSEENPRTFNILKSLTYSDVDKFSNLLVKYRDTTTNGEADVLVFDYEMFKLFPEVKINGFVTYLAKNSIVAFIDNSEIPSTEKEGIRKYFDRKVQQSNFSTETLSSTDKLIIYHVHKNK